MKTNEVRPIDANTLKKSFEEDGHLSSYIEEFIDNAPTIDAEPVRHGQWINKKTVPAFHHCSICGVTNKMQVPEPPKGKWGGAGCIVGTGYSVAWRVYDAQYWGVPQRRKRIYLVADFASERAGEILFERESMRRDSAPSREAWEGIAEDAEGCAGRSGGSGCLNPWDVQSHRLFAEDGVFHTLYANERAGQQSDGVVYCLQGNGIDRADTAGCNGRGWREGGAYTLNTIDRPAVVYDARGNGAGGLTNYDR